MPRARTIASAITTFALVAVMFLTGPAAFAQDGESEEGGGGDSTASVTEIVENPEDFTGQEVTVESTITDLVTLRAFTLNAQGSSMDLLVAASREVLPGTLQDDMLVNVTGVVHEFSDDFRADAISFDSDSEAYDEFDGGPVLIATSVTPLSDDDGELRIREADPDYGLNPGPDADDNTPTLVDIFEDSDAYIGATVTTAAQIVDTLDDEEQALILSTDDAHDDLLVVAAPDAVPTSAAEGALVNVTGTIAAFEPGLVFEIGGTPVELSDEVVDDYDGEILMLAESVKVVGPVLGSVVDDILEDPDGFTGQTVSVVGKVSAELGPQAFTFNGTEGFLGIGGEDLLVIGPQDVIPADDVTDQVIAQVRGTVRILEASPDADVDETTAQDLGINPDEEPYTEFEGEPVIIAESAQVLATEPGETVEEIIADPDAFLGEPVTVAGNVDGSVSDRAFTLDGVESLLGLMEENLLVIAPAHVLEDAGLTEDAIVVVSGTVRRFDPEDVFTYEGEQYQLDADGIAYDEFQDDAVIVADQVSVVAVN